MSRWRVVQTLNDPLTHVVEIEGGSIIKYCTQIHVPDEPFVAWFTVEATPLTCLICAGWSSCR